MRCRRRHAMRGEVGLRTVTQSALTVLAVLAFWGIRRPLVELWRTGGRSFRVVAVLAAGAFGSASTQGNAGHIVLLISLVVALVLSVNSPMHRPASSVRPRHWNGGFELVAAVFLWVALFVLNIVNGKPSLLDAGWSFIAVGVLILAVVLRSEGVDADGLAIIGTLFLGITCLSGLIVAEPWRECDKFKCSAVGALFKGPFVSENYLAVVATFTAIWWIGSKRSMGRRLGLVLALGTVLATGTRSALVALGVTALWALVAFAFVQPSRENPATRRLPGVVAAVSSAGMILTSLWMIQNAQEDTFSDRGNIWIQAYEAIAQGHLTEGLGYSQWAGLQSIGLIPDHFSHSDYLILLFSGGVIGLTLFGLVAMGLMTKVRGSTRWETVIGAAPVILLMVYGLTEVIWNPMALDSFSFLIIGLFLQRPAIIAGAAAGTRDKSIDDSIDILTASADPTPAARTTNGR